MATNPSTNTNSSPEAFSLRGLPLEIRQLIYPQALELQPGREPPPLFLALGPEPDLLAEAAEVLMKVNFVLTMESEKNFKLKTAEELLKIRYLTVILETFTGVCDHCVIQRRVKTIKKLWGSNNLETITFDLTKESHLNKSHLALWIPSVKKLIIGARGSVNKVTIVVDSNEPGSRRRYWETKLLQMFFIVLGVPPRQEEPPKGTTLRIFTWEGNGLEILARAENVYFSITDTHN